MSRTQKIALAAAVAVPAGAVAWRVAADVVFLLAVGCALGEPWLFVRWYFGG